MRHAINTNIFGRLLVALTVIFCGLFIGIVGYFDKAQIDAFNNTKVAVEIKKIDQFDRVPNGRSGSRYQALVEFNYLNQIYRNKAIITENEYQHKNQIQQYPKTAIKMYFSPINQKAYSQSALEQYGSNLGFYFAMLYALGSLIIGWLIMFKALK